MAYSVTAPPSKKGKKLKKLLTQFNQQLFYVVKTLLKLINTSANVNKLLLSGEERMALGADVNAEFAALGRTGNEAFAASTLNGYFFVSRMESFLHDNDSTP